MCMGGETSDGMISCGESFDSVVFMHANPLV